MHSLASICLSWLAFLDRVTEVVAWMPVMVKGPICCTMDPSRAETQCWAAGADEPHANVKLMMPQ